MSLEDMTPDQLVDYARSLEGPYRTFQQLAQDPSTREALLTLVKQKYPNQPIPELDAKKQVREEVGVVAKKVEELQLEILKRDALERVREGRQGIMEKYALSKEDMPHVEKLMVAAEDNPYPIPSYDAAARVYLASRRSATPTPANSAPPLYEMPAKDIWGPGIGNAARLDKIAIGRAWDIWGDLKAGKVPGLGAARGASM